MGETNQGIVLRQRPVGLLRPEDVELVDLPMPEAPEGGFVLEVVRLGIDATVRSWLDAGEGYLPAVKIGEVVRCAGLGRVVASRSPNYREGDAVTTLSGWQRYVACPDDFFSTNVGRADAIDPDAYLAVYSSTGLTAYVGMLDIGEVREGDTVVVSAAAGATGSIAAQIAKLHGCRVVGIAGSPEKCAWLVDDLGLDGAIDHRHDDVPARLRELCPKGVDVYFDNVGGVVLDQVLARIAQGARVVLCGAISSYNDAHRPPGPANYLNLIQRRASMRGFLALDHWGRFAEIKDALQRWVEAGQLRYRTELFTGLDSAPDALNALFIGRNTGKIVIRP